MTQLSPQPTVRKAIIPAAGFGTRMFPATKTIKKEFFPIVDREGRAKPIILAIVEEAVEAGVEEVGIVVQEGDLALFEAFFKTPPSSALFEKLKPRDRDYCKYLQSVGEKVTLLTQDVPDGFGYAVYCARDWVGDEPFLLLLGDHLYKSFVDKNCASQLIDVYQQSCQNAIGVRVIQTPDIHHYGCVTGNWQNLDAVLSISQVYEKPTVEYAQQHLRVRGMNHNEFLSVFGLYVLAPTIFELLGNNINNNIREGGEFQLTSCLEQLRRREGMVGYLVKGQCFDTGLPDVYRQTAIDFRHL